MPCVLLRTQSEREGEAVSRPKCGVCEGSGKVDNLSFSKPRRLITQTCSHCHGRGTVALKVDLFDVLEYLRDVGTGAFGAAADAIEKKFGPDPVPPRALPQEKKR